MTPLSTPPSSDSAPEESGAALVERVVDSRILHKGRYLTFRIDTIERADGSRATRDIAGHPGAVAIVALDGDGHVLLVRQFRSPAGRVLLEIPAGTLDAGPDGSIEDPDLAARRELEEETGYRAGTWRVLTRFFTAPGFTTEYMHLYLATDLRPADGERLGPDEDERLHLVRLPWRDAVAAVERGDIVDAKSIVGLLWLARSEVDGAQGTEHAFGESVRARFRISMGDYVRASLAVYRHSLGRVWNVAITLALIVLVLLAGATWLVLLAVALAILLMTGIWTVPLLWWTLRRRPDIVAADVEVEADDRGIRYVTAFGTTDSAWSTFSRAYESKPFIFLETGIGPALIIPQRAFNPTDLATLYRLLDRAGLLPAGR